MRGGFAPLLIVVCLFTLGCQPVSSEVAAFSESERPVTAGTPDDADPAVVGIVRADEPTRLRCTGTVISERVVLTAAHCDVQWDAASYAVFFGADVTAGGKVVAILEAVAHPDFDDTATHDLALLLLAEAAPTDAMQPIAEPVIAGAPPVPVRLVGFGDTVAGAEDNGRKREGWAQTTEVTDRFVVLGANPSLPCNGDSGGPVFAATGAGEALAAVVSRGDASCETYGKATRVDVHLASFIEPYIAATAPGSVSAGRACLYDEQCTGGLCVEATDEPLLRYCSQECGKGDACGAGMSCAAGVCRFPIPSPGAIGSSCAEHADCLRGECLDEGWCSIRCVSGRGDCPGGYQCEHLGGVDFFCTPAPNKVDGDGDEGGCAVGKRSGSWGGWGALLAGGIALLIRLSRRSR